MSEIKHPEAEKLYTNILKFSDKQTAAEIVCAVDLPQYASVEEKAIWVNTITERMENVFDDTVIKEIRMGCHCTENGKLDELKVWLRGLYLASENLEQFVDKVNENATDWYIKDGELYTKYFDCSCPMLDGIERLSTKTWCQCTAGFGKALFDYVFGYDVDIEILQSIKMGSDICLIKVSRKC